MTALVIYKEKDGFQIVSDGACYDDVTFCLQQEVSKVSPLTPFAGFIACRGVSRVSQLFRVLAEEGIRTFDHLIDNSGDIARYVTTEVARSYSLAGDTKAITFTIYIGGYSLIRGKFELYALSPDDRDDPLHGVPRRAFEPTPVEAVVLAPMPPDRATEPLGLWLEEDGQQKPDLRAHRMPLWIHAARIGQSDDGNCYVGSFIEETWIGHDYYNSRIIYRYNDVIGQRLVPQEGETDQILALCEERGRANGIAA